MAPVDVLEQPRVDEGIEAVLQDSRDNATSQQSPYASAKYVPTTLTLDREEFMNVAMHDLKGPLVPFYSAIEGILTEYHAKRVRQLMLQGAKLSEIDEDKINAEIEPLNNVFRWCKAIPNQTRVIQELYDIVAEPIESQGSDNGTTNLDFYVKILRNLGLQMKARLDNWKSEHSDLIASDEEDEELKIYSDIASKTIGQYLVLLDDIPEVIKLIQQEKVNYSQVDIDGLTRDVIAENSDFASANRVNVSYERKEASKNLSPINNSPLALQILVRNLLSNAIKYSPSGSNVSVTVGDDGNNVLVTVRDFGIGMDKDSLEKMLTENSRYTGAKYDAYRLGREVSTSGYGSLLMKVLAQRAGAIIEGKSLKDDGTEATKDHGSEFTVVIPYSFKAKLQASVDSKKPKLVARVPVDVTLSELVRYAADKAGYNGNAEIKVQKEKEFSAEDKDRVYKIVDALVAYFHRIKLKQDQRFKGNDYAISVTIGNGEPGVVWVNTKYQGKGNLLAENRYQRRKQTRDSVLCPPGRLEGFVREADGEISQESLKKGWKSTTLRLNYNAAGNFTDGSPNNN